MGYVAKIAIVSFLFLVNITTFIINKDRDVAIEYSISEKEYDEIVEKIFPEFDDSIITTNIRLITHEVGHFIVSLYLKSKVHELFLDYDNGGHVLFEEDDDKKKLFVYLGGYIAEYIIFGNVQTGCEEDIQSALELITYDNRLNMNSVARKMLKYRKFVEDIIRKNEYKLIKIADSLKHYMKSKKIHKLTIDDLNLLQDLYEYEFYDDSNYEFDVV